MNEYKETTGLSFQNTADGTPLRDAPLHSAYEEITIEPPLDVEFDFSEETAHIDIEPAEITEPTAENVFAANAGYSASMPSDENVQKQHMSQTRKNKISRGIIYAALSILSILWILPFIGIFFESFRCESTGLTGYIIPKKWGFDNYVRLFTETQFPRWYGNTFIMGLVTSVVQTIFVMAVSYALSRNRFKGRKFLMNVMLVFGMFPGFLTLILLYTWLNDWHLTMANAPWGLILIYCASSGMGYYIAKGFFDTISHSLDEAAQVDGATQFQVFYKIIMPLSKPIVIYTILMGFMGPWADFVMASFMANNSSAGYNTAAGLQWLLTDSMINDYYTTFCAGGVVVALPATILFICLQKYYVAGVTGGAVKG